jgi:hypothetical protein
MTKKQTKAIFEAGRLSIKEDFTFKEWYNAQIGYTAYKDRIVPNYDRLTMMYKECYYSKGISPSKGLNSREYECMTIRHIVRSLLKKQFKSNITYKEIAKLEYNAGASSEVNHSSIINSLKLWDGDVLLADKEVVNAVTKIFNKYIYNEPT